MAETCFLAPFSRTRCEGRLIRAHLIAKQALRRRGHDPWDERSWVWACGGDMGLEGHHGAADAYKLVVPASALPQSLIELAEEANLIPYLERRYGYQRPGSETTS